MSSIHSIPFSHYNNILSHTQTHTLTSTFSMTSSSPISLPLNLQSLSYPFLWSARITPKDCNLFIMSSILGSNGMVIATAMVAGTAIFIAFCLQKQPTTTAGATRFPIIHHPRPCISTGSSNFHFSWVNLLLPRWRFGSKLKISFWVFGLWCRWEEEEEEGRKEEKGTVCRGCDGTKWKWRWV